MIVLPVGDMLRVTVVGGNVENGADDGEVAAEVAEVTAEVADDTRLEATLEMLEVDDGS